MLTALAGVLAIAGAVLHQSTTGQAQQATFVSPGEGGAGSRFQIVGEAGWTPGETITLEFTFVDVPPAQAEAFAGPFYRTEQVTALRDGTWSFPVVLNEDVLPFPLWRPGYIAIRARGAAQTTLTLFTYMVDGRGPQGPPPLAEFGFGPGDSGHAGVLGTVALFLAATGVLAHVSGRLRMRRSTAG
ncbi:MAG: hypothetical protein HY873_11045 [Chloroflexi bacterium]|nr:hypothetical protein [Chloroflexota bacterium]